MDFLSSKSVNVDIQNIIINQGIHAFFLISDDLFEKKYNYLELYSLIVGFPFISCICKFS